MSSFLQTKSSFYKMLLKVLLPILVGVYDCTKIIIPEVPPKNLYNFLKYLSKTHLLTDIFVGFALNDKSLYTTYSQTILRALELNSEVQGIHFNREDLPLRGTCKHLVFTDSFEVLK